MRCIYDLAKVSPLLQTSINIPYLEVIKYNNKFFRCNLNLICGIMRNIIIAYQLCYTIYIYVHIHIYIYVKYRKELFVLYTHNNVAPIEK